ncbi:uncharacterized protein LOC141912936 [Tubulanus polymorphus]|uniref:uncharacterized protein LOC141912936 n=1 Tax=Tubulanus polymorphus TaxID=672921 RepID=UPI003DA35A32
MPENTETNKQSSSSPDRLSRRPSVLTAYHDIAAAVFSLGRTMDVDELFLSAARDGELEKMQNFLQRRDTIVNVDIKDKRTGNTPLIWAAKRGHPKIVHLLLKHGADPTLRNYDLKTAIQVASPVIKSILLNSVENPGSSHRHLLQAAWQGNADIVRKILKEGRMLDINCKNADGLTPLLLVTRDADMFERLSHQQKGRSEYNPVSVVLELIKCRGDIDSTDNEGKTPLHYASSSKSAVSSQLVKILLQEKAKTEARDKRCFTPIHCASETGNIDIVQVLIDGGSDVNARGFAGATPLHISAYKGHDRVASVLLSNGADVTVVNDSGLTAVDVAKSKKIKTTLREAWVDATQNKVEKALLNPVRPPTREGSKLSIDDIRLEGSTPRTPKRPFSRQLTNAEKAMLAEENMMKDLESGRYATPTPTPLDSSRRIGASGPLRTFPAARNDRTPRIDVSGNPVKTPEQLLRRTQSQRATGSARKNSDPGVSGRRPTLPDINLRSSITSMTDEESSPAYNTKVPPAVVISLDNDDVVEDLMSSSGATSSQTAFQKRRRHSDELRSPSLNDLASSCDDFIFKGRSSTKTYLEDIEDVFSPPPRLTPIRTPVPSANDRSRLRNLDTINETTSESLKLDLSALQTSIDEGVTFDQLKNLPQPTQTFITQLGLSEVTSANKENQPKSGPDAVKLACDNVIELVRGKSILKSEFNIEESRGKKAKKPDENSPQSSNNYSSCVSTLSTPSPPPGRDDRVVDPAIRINTTAKLPGKIVNNNYQTTAVKNPTVRDDSDKRSSGSSSVASSSTLTQHSSRPGSEIRVEIGGKDSPKSSKDSPKVKKPSASASPKENLAAEASAKLRAAAKDNAISRKPDESNSVTNRGAPEMDNKIRSPVTMQQIPEVSQIEEISPAVENKTSAPVKGVIFDKNGIKTVPTYSIENTTNQQKSEMGAITGQLKTKSVLPRQESGSNEPASKNNKAPPPSRTESSVVPNSVVKKPAPASASNSASAKSVTAAPSGDQNKNNSPSAAAAAAAAKPVSNSSQVPKTVNEKVATSSQSVRTSVTLISYRDDKTKQNPIASAKSGSVLAKSSVPATGAPAASNKTGGTITVSSSSNKIPVSTTSSSATSNSANEIKMAPADNEKPAGSRLQQLKSVASRNMGKTEETSNAAAATAAMKTASKTVAQSLEKAIAQTAKSSPKLVKKSPLLSEEKVTDHIKLGFSGLKALFNDRPKKELSTKEPAKVERDMPQQTPLVSEMFTDIKTNEQKEAAGGGQLTVKRTNTSMSKTNKSAVGQRNAPSSAKPKTASQKTNNTTSNSTGNIGKKNSGAVTTTTKKKVTADVKVFVTTQSRAPAPKSSKTSAKTKKGSSGSKRKGKKNSSNKDATRMSYGGRDPSKTAFVSGIGWHVATDCNENVDVAAVKILPDSSDEESGDDDDEIPEVIEAEPVAPPLLNIRGSFSQFPCTGEDRPEVIIVLPEERSRATVAVRVASPYEALEELAERVHDKIHFRTPSPQPPVVLPQTVKTIREFSDTASATSSTKTSEYIKPIKMSNEARGDSAEKAVGNKNEEINDENIDEIIDEILTIKSDAATLNDSMTNAMRRNIDLQKQISDNSEDGSSILTPSNSYQTLPEAMAVLHADNFDQMRMKIRTATRPELSIKEEAGGKPDAESVDGKLDAESADRAAASGEDNVAVKPPTGRPKSAAGKGHATKGKTPRSVGLYKEIKSSQQEFPEDGGNLSRSDFGSDRLSLASDSVGDLAQSPIDGVPIDEVTKEILNSTDNRTYMSRIGRRSRQSTRPSSAMSDLSSVGDKEELIGWKKGTRIGRGAYGTVWLGLTDSGNLIAVKQIELNTQDNKAKREYEKIEDELELLKTLKHRNIVEFYGTSLEDGVVSIFMEYIPGGSIADLLARFGALEEAVFSIYTKQILEGLEHIHSKGVIHRDIKGGNVMLTQDGVIKLIDFGCAKRLSLNHSASNKQMLKSMHGTPYWMAPEVVMETGHGQKSDIWSVGCTVFEMATRRPPWAEMTPMAAIFAIGSDKPIPQLPDKFSAEARSFVENCLTRDQDKRATATQLLRHAFICRHVRQKHKRSNSFAQLTNT